MDLNLFFYIIVFLFGLAVGSFLNCIIYRLQIESSESTIPEKDSHSRSFLIGHSYCPNCKHILGWQDLIPVLSFLFLKGKCRHCQKPISFQYPAVELAAGLLFALIFYSIFQHSSISTFFQLIYFIHLLFVTSALLVIFVFDLRHYIIPDKVVYPAIIVSGIWYLVSGILFNLYTSYEILIIIGSAFGAAAFFLLIILISKGRWMGWGDVKLAFLMGLLLGYPNILIALFLAFFFGAIIGIGLILAGKKGLKSEVPFGPFLITGTFIALFWGKEIIEWYIHLLT